jgi:hypothetical protein
MAAPDQGGGKAKGQTQDEFRVHRPPLHPGAFLSHEEFFTSAVKSIKEVGGAIGSRHNRPEPLDRAVRRLGSTQPSRSFRNVSR